MTGNAIATKKLRQVQNIKELLMNDQARGQLAAVAAKHMNPERMMRVVANAVRTTPQLQDCEPMSFLGALMTCASLGLEPNTPLGHAYLIPFKNKKKGITEVQLVIGYKGFIDLAWRSGKVTYLHADVVYDDDDVWSYEHGSDAHLRHRSGPRKGAKTHAYCHIKVDLGGGREGQAFAVLPWEDVIRTRDASQGWKTAVKNGKTKFNPWFTHEDRMAAKTAVRALANAGGMPMSVEFRDAIDVDDRNSDFAAFAMDPTSGVIEGETIDEETGEVIEGEGDDGSDSKPKAAKPDPDPKPDPKPKPKAAKPEAEKPKAEKPKAEKPDHVKSLVLRVVDDLRAADVSGSIDDTMEMFSDQLDLLHETAPGAYQEIIDAEQQARERVAA